MQCCHLEEIIRNYSLFFIYLNALFQRRKTSTTKDFAGISDNDRKRRFEFIHNETSFILTQLKSELSKLFFTSTNPGVFERLTTGRGFDQKLQTLTSSRMGRNPNEWRTQDTNTWCSSVFVRLFKES